MLRKITIIVLIILILGSLGLILAISFSQNNLDLSFLTNLFQKTDNKPLVTSNPFPLASSSPVAIATPTTTTTEISSSTTPAETTNITPSERETPIEQLIVTGLSRLTANKETQSLFVDQESGNVYSLDDQNNIARKSYTTLTGTAAAYLGTKNNTGYMISRQVNNLSLTDYLGKFNLSYSSSTEPAKVEFTPLKVSISSLAISPNKQQVAYLAKEGSRSNLYIGDWTFTKPKKVWQSDLNSWDISWPEANLLFITSKPSFDYPGNVYELDLKTGKTKLVLEKINGLTVSISPNGDRMLYSKSLLSGFKLYIYDLKAKTGSLAGLDTLPEKCSWLDNDNIYCAVPRAIISGRYPDDWYQGRISFADELWRVNLKTKETSQLKSLRGSYDLVNLMIDSKNKWLYAINKTDQKLQAFTLEEF